MQEASLGRVADPAGGAWYLESLTDQLARAGWAFFQEIEARGGAAAALESGFVAEAVGRVRAERPPAAIVGASHFPDPDQAPVAVETIEPPPTSRPVELRMPGDDSRCPPLTPIRLSQPFEEAKAQ
jgi:methylmalonyl-CoA mutase